MKISEAQHVLAQAKLLDARAQALESNMVSRLAEPGMVPGADKASFGDLMRDSVNQVNQTMAGAQAKTAAFLNDEPGASLVETMVAVNKAQVAFKTVVEVRNQLVQAYKDIANMPI